jgi:thiol:disulfide interchange protein
MEQQPSAAAPLTARRVALGRVRFVEGFRAGYDQALQDGRPMLVFFTAEWCHFCHEMAEEAFNDAQVVRLASQFTCIVVDADAEPETCKQMHVDGFPTIQFLTPRGAPLNRLVGKRPSEQLIASMHEALQSVARRKLPSDDALRR